MDLADLSARLETISARYAADLGFARDADWFVLKLQEEVGELTQVHLMRSGRAREKGHSPDELDAAFATECADALGMVLLVARNAGVDIERAMTEKWLQWETR